MSELPSLVIELANFLVPAGVFAIMALGLNIQWGHTGLFNAGVAAFFALGAYTAAILMTAPVPPQIFYAGHLGYSWPFVGAAVAAAAVSGLAGFLIALPLLRLRADYFAIATLALAETVRLVINNAERWTGGSTGIYGVPRPFDAFTRGEPGLSLVYMAILCVSILLLLILAVDYITRTPWGRVLRGIREDEEATLALGKNVNRFRLQAFVIGCMIMGLAGAIYASLLRFVAPSQFDPLATFTIYVMVILGGSGNNKGVVVGAFLFYAFDWVSVRLDDGLPPDWALRFPNIRLMIIGVILVAFIIFRPEGIFKEKKRVFPPVRSR